MTNQINDEPGYWEIIRDDELIIIYNKYADGHGRNYLVSVTDGTIR